MKPYKQQFEAVAPYFASSYTTLVSIVQSISLYTLLDKNFDKALNNLTVAWESLITLLVICIIWHRYIAHTQYLAWRLKPMDTLIPLTFGILQFFMVISCDKYDLATFSYGFSLIFLLGWIAYINAIHRFREKESSAHILLWSIKKTFCIGHQEYETGTFGTLFTRHFLADSYNYEEEIDIKSFLNKIINYEETSLQLMFFVFALGIVCTFVNYYWSGFFWIKILSLLCLSAVCFLTLYLDISKFESDNRV